MGTPFPIQITAAQVGTYFVGQYYEVLQHQPEYIHQFFSDSSTMIRVDGLQQEAASGTLQIHSLIMSLCYSAVEIKTAHSLESWNGGVLVMISGSVQVKTFRCRRNFVQTFFLAPQQKGYFVLNDIFHFIDDESIQHHPAVLLAQKNSDSKLNVPTEIPEPVSSYLLHGDIQARGLSAPANIKLNGCLDEYDFTDQCLQQVTEPINNLENSSCIQSNGLLQNRVNSIEDQFPPGVEEPQKHTYASILRVAKGQARPSMALQQCSNKNVSLASEWSDTPRALVQQSFDSFSTHERSGAETKGEVSGDYEGEIKSVYVRNLIPTISASEIAQEFKKFGKLSSDGVAIRGRQDLGVCYAFVEFEDMDSVHKAVKAGSVKVAGRQLYIEGRRANSNIPSRGGRRGRGRGSYQSDASRGRFDSRGYGRWNAHDGEYNRPKGNCFYRPSRQE